MFLKGKNINTVEFKMIFGNLVMVKTILVILLASDVSNILLFIIISAILVS